MAQDSRFDRYELFVATATVGAHANAPQQGFRHRDVKFLIELFSNWVEVSMRESILSIQNTQVARYVSELVTEGYARRISRKGHPLYRLTRTGLIDLISRIVNREYFSEPAHFFFLLYFIKNYRPRLEELVKNEGKQFPLALKLELEGLLDAAALIQREVLAVRRELKKLEERIQDAKSTSALATDLAQKGLPLEEIVKQAERRYPYELNTQKPLTQLIAEIPEKMRHWELETGNLRRAREIWTPAHGMLVSYMQELKKLERVVSY